MAKYEERDEDGIRKQLLDFAKESSNGDKQDYIAFNTTDVTGSLGCWGIVQQ